MEMIYFYAYYIFTLIMVDILLLLKHTLRPAGLVYHYSYVNGLLTSYAVFLVIAIILQNTAAHVGSLEERSSE